jgi:hypothetical protein
MTILIINILLASPQIECPRVLPGSDTPLPAGIHLSREDELKQRVACFCNRVMAEERRCIAAAFGRYSVNICKQRTAAWILQNLALPNDWAQAGGVSPTPRRVLPMNIREVH